MEEINFIEGVFDKRNVEKTIPSLHGTIVTWKPSSEFFTNSEVDLKFLRDLLVTITCLCRGLVINLVVDGQKESFYSRYGLNDYVDNKLGKNEILKNRLSINYENGKNKMNLVLTYGNGYSGTIIPYVNTGLTESGPHITAFKTAITRELNKFFKKKKWLKEKDTNLSGEDIQEGLYLVFNLTTSGVSYDAQVKSRVVNIETKEFIQYFSERLQVWLENNEKEIKEIADKAINARKAREAAKKAREAVRKPKEKGLKAKMQLSDKFIDCVSKNPNERNLLLVEGKSAASSAIEARNVQTDAIYQLRGKVISCRKTTVDKLLANQEISDIVKIIGAGFGESFDVSKMCVDKVVITSDQDSDGASIELLLTNLFFTYMRPLVEAGKLYRAVTPLYGIKAKGSKETIYCYSEEELENWKNNNKEKSYELSHFKGLGEVDASVLQEICFKNQRFKRLTISDLEKTDELMEILMGKSVIPRKEFVYENATRLGFNFD